MTSDGGATWQTKSFGPAPVFDSLNCPSASTCVATAGGLNYGPNTVPQEDVYWTVDAGTLGDGQSPFRVAWCSP